MDISELNTLSHEDFLTLFANTFEHHPAAAEAVYTLRPFTDSAQILTSFYRYMDALPMEDKMQVLVNHPMLGSKKIMTKESTNEQSSAGLNKLLDDEAALLEQYNLRYFKKFGFPYIVCVKEISKDAILLDIQKRYENDLDTETLRGVEEVKKIAKHRILGFIK